MAGADVKERKALFRERVRGLPLIATILSGVAAGEPVARETVLEGLHTHVPPAEAERQIDTAVNWGRFADLFDYDADDASFRPARETDRGSP